MKKEKLIKAITVLTIICALITFISASSGSLLALYLSYKFNIDTSDADSIGIIGGADGPTVIYVTGQSSSHLFTVIFASLTILGVICLIIPKNSIKKT